MPIGKGTNGDDRRGSNTVKRETFRPPWVKEGPDDLRPKPSDFLTKSKQMSKDAAAQKAEAAKKVSETAENGAPFVRPQLKPVPPKDPTKLQSKEVKVPIKLNSTADRSMNYPEPKPSLQQNDDQNLDKTVQQHYPIPRQDSLKKVGAPKAPPMPPPAPKFPKASDLKSLNDKQKAAIESLKARPKVRPDWTAMLKEVESGPKLKHVQCNDRSKPLLPKVKDSDKSQFIYESERTEKDDSHNQLLKEIQSGVSLKKVKTNDRSKPILEGLRKFRRQMTIEEQIIKSQSMASIPPEEIADEADELDDIDKVRDDLQSTKQMLAIELRNKESLARENKRLQTRLAQLEAELDKELTNKKVVEPAAENDDKMLTSLKSEAADARKTAEDLQKKYHEASNQLDNTKSELEEVRKQKQVLEKRLHETLSGKRISISERQDSIRRDSESEPEEVHDSDGDDEDDEKKERKLQKEVKQLRNKLRSYKNKEDNAKKERIALKTQGKRLQQAIKDERRKYRDLKKEVHKMAALLKDPDDSDEPEEEEEEEEETQSESESETSESETESEGEKSFSEAEDAPVEKQRTNLTKRTKGYEGRLTALKKANYMLKTNVERLQDDLNKQKEESSSLQQELDSVLAELG